MTEWGVFLVIGALLTFLGTTLPPIIKLNTTITRLNVIVDRVEQLQKEQLERENKRIEEFALLKRDVAAAHTRLDDFKNRL